MNTNEHSRALLSTIKNRYLSAAELASYLGVGRNSIANWVRQGLIPEIRLGRRRLYRLDRIESALEQLER